jgi:arabinosaccharide transport system substrate-binding protein
MQLSPGSWSILLLALVSSIAIAFWPIPHRGGRAFWLFSFDHDLIYKPAIAAWNRAHPDPRDQVIDYVISNGPLGRRLESGFLSGTPVPDAAEVEVQMMSGFFAGPLDAVGFADLTDRIHREGLDRQIVSASFSPWTDQGRIFGLPHDVHPVLLAYRADIVEAAGIDVSKIETWDDFVRVMSPLVRRDSSHPRYLLNVWETNKDAVEILLLQAGGGFFDARQRPILDSEINAHVLATIVSWIAGPGGLCMNAPNFDAEGNYLFLHGNVLCTLMPDWLGGIWRKDLAGLGGKMKLMPLPAWTPGGLRTSVEGGSMLGIPKRAPDFEKSWAFAKHLYLDRDIARNLFRTVGIISPVSTFWDDPVYDQPNPYFCGQPVGRLYIAMAPKVPLRSSSPFQPQALLALSDALIRLRHYAEQHDIFAPAALLPRARLEVAVAQASIERRIQANAFLRDSPAQEQSHE